MTSRVPLRNLFRFPQEMRPIQGVGTPKDGCGLRGLFLFDGNLNVWVFQQVLRNVSLFAYPKTKTSQSG